MTKNNATIWAITETQKQKHEANWAKIPKPYAPFVEALAVYREARANKGKRATEIAISKAKAHLKAKSVWDQYHQDALGLELANGKGRYAAIMRNTKGQPYIQYFTTRGLEDVDASETGLPAWALLEMLLQDGYQDVSPGAMEILSMFPEWEASPFNTEAIIEHIDYSDHGKSLHLVKAS